MRELTRGLVLAGLALFIILAGLALALSERAPATATPHRIQAPTETVFVPSPVVPTPLDLNSLFLTQTSPPAPTPCPVPAGWVAVTVASGDTLLGLAAQHGVSLPLVLQANCLITDSTFVGATIYLPAAATGQPAIACGPPPGWVFYTVQPGDTLSALSRRYGVLIYDLRQANCIPGVALTVGQKIFVPPIVVLTDTPLLIDTPTPIPSATLTALPSLTSAPSSTVANPDTATATVAPSETAAGPAQSASETATLTLTVTETATVPDTATALPSETPTETATTGTP